MVRVADYIADFIYKQGVRHVFMLSGGGSIFLDDGLAKHRYLKEVAVRNEAAAPMMAEAYARLNRNLGVVYVTTGPGGTNAVSGLAESWVDSAPILIVSGQVKRRHTTHKLRLKPRTFGTQELDIISVVKPITKYAVMVDSPENIRYHLEKAVYLARSGRPGPVWLDIPLDVQSSTINENKLKGFVIPKNSSNRRLLKRQFNKVIGLLKCSKSPLIIAGQGIRISKAVSEFKDLIERVNLPVITSRLGQDLLPYSHGNNFGHGGVKGSRFSGFIMKSADLVICLGSRLSVSFTGENFDVFNHDAKVVMVDIDKAELEKPGLKIDLKIRSDAKYFIGELKTRINKKRLPDYSAWLKVCRQYKEEHPLINSTYKRNPINLYYFISRLDALSNNKHIFVSDAGSSYYVTGQALRFEKGQREITSGAFASMGLSIPLAIGASFAEEDAQILAVTGDGSLELNIQELKTMSFYNLNIKLFVINNGGYVSIRNTQDILCSGRYINSDQRNCNDVLNFQKVADAFGLPYCLIEKYEEVDSKIKKIIAKTGPAFVEVCCDNKQKIIDSPNVLPS